MRQSLLAQGAELLATRGYNGTGLKEILDAVNVPKGSFYNYFKSKEAYVGEIIEHYADGLLRSLDAYIARSNEDPVALIKSVYGYMLADFAAKGCAQGCLIGSLAGEVGSTSPVCQAALKRAFERWKMRFVELLERGQQAGQIRKDLTAERMADVFWNAWEGGILRMKVEGDTSSIQETLDTLLDHLFAERTPSG